MNKTKFKKNKFIGKRKKKRLPFVSNFNLISC